MKLHRNENGLLRGDLIYETGFPATVRADIAPVVFPCTECCGLTLHVLVEQPTGLGIKIPFARKPIATTNRDYGLVCNNCTQTTGISGKKVVESLERRLVPSEICDVIDRFLVDLPGYVPAYSIGFIPFVLDIFGEDDGFIAASLAVYSRGE